MDNLTGFFKICVPIINLTKTTKASTNNTKPNTITRREVFIMAICAILSQKLDSRKDGDDCLFNGYLEDYLSFRENEIEDNLKETFEKVLETDPDT